jgi:hypothetical protein
MTKFAEQLKELLQKRINEDPFDVVESLISLSATMMADDSSLDLDQAKLICVSIFSHGWNARRRAFLPSDKHLH